MHSTSATVTRLVGAALLGLAATLPAGAASSASSAASESVGLSSNGVSASLRTSSGSSTNNQVAQGEYRVVEVLALADAPERVALRLQRADASGPATDDNAFLLLLPREVHASSGVDTGSRVQATQRSFGIEFAHAQTRQAFFLVLHERSMQDLQTRKVS